MRWPALLAAIAFIVLSGAWMLRESGWSNGHAGSARNNGDRGLSLARDYLAADPGRSVGVLERPLSLATASPAATVFRLRPHEEVQHGEGPAVADLGDAELAWIEAGGRLVIAIDGRWRGLSVGSSTDGRRALPLLAGVRLPPQPLRPLYGKLADEAAPAFLAGEGTAIGRVRRGAGELWLLSCPEALENAGLTHGDHLALLAALAGAGRPVLFDERSNGAAGAVGAVDVLLGWGLGGALALALLALAALAWRRAAVPGPESPPADPPATGAVDGVPAVAALYAQAMAPRACVALAFRRLQRAAAARHGGSAGGKAALDRLLPNWRTPGADDPATTRAALRRLNHASRSLRDEHPRRRP